MDTGTIKHDEGKTQWHLWPMDVAEDCARIWMQGVEEYGKWNWKKGIEHMRLYDAIMRHLKEYREGSSYDQKSKFHPLAHVICDAAMLLWQIKHNVGKDDR